MAGVRRRPRARGAVWRSWSDPVGESWLRHEFGLLCVGCPSLLDIAASSAPTTIGQSGDDDGRAGHKESDRGNDLGGASLAVALGRGTAWLGRARSSEIGDTVVDVEATVGRGVLVRS